MSFVSYRLVNDKPKRENISFLSFNKMLQLSFSRHVFLSDTEQNKFRQKIAPSGVLTHNL